MLPAKAHFVLLKTVRVNVPFELLAQMNEERRCSSPENVVDEEQHVLSFLVTEVLGH